LKEKATKNDYLQTYTNKGF